MANERAIKSGVVIDGKTYKAGMENELAEVLKPGQAQYLIDQGAIEGSWSGAKAKAEPEGKAESGKAASKGK